MHVLDRVKRANTVWRTAKLSRRQLGKYIIVFASLLHLGWAALLLISPSALNSTPVHILGVIFGGRIRAAVVLIIVAVAAAAFPFMRYRVSNGALALMLVPQQTLLIMSAGAGVWATMLHRYADGVVRPWPFILGDQLPVILTALLYSAALLESALEPPNELL